MNFHQITPELLKTKIKKLKSLVHGSQRDALYKEMNSNIRQRAELHTDGGKTVANWVNQFSLYRGK
jgi:hypothetical protein